MRTRTAAALALVSAAVLLGCAPRVHVFTYHKAKVSEPDLNRDVQELRDTAGVRQVMPRLDGQGNASIELYVDDGQQLPGQERATGLGYRRVRN